MGEIDQERLNGLLNVWQSGVIARWQLREAGAGPADIRRMLRRRDLTPIHPGVYVNHTGPPTWEQRAWAAVLACWPAALAGRSALPNASAEPIDVMVATARTVRAPAGVRVHRSRDLAEVNWNAYPPRQRLEFAALDAALGADDDAETYGILAEVVQRTHLGAGDLRDALRQRSRVPRRGLVERMLSDLATGANSVLERAYLRDVERAHGLPRGDRQVRDRSSSGGLERDVLYRAWATVVELDGHAFHGSAWARDADSARDLAAAAERDLVTVRLTFGLVSRSPCEVAVQVGRLLARRGWGGSVRPCGRCPSVVQGRRSVSSGDTKLRP